MNASVWILEENDDNRSLAMEKLRCAGIATVEFSSSHQLLRHARTVRPPIELPQAAIIDAKTAYGRERDIRSAVPTRLVVLTTWPAQLASWISLGVSRYLLKPYDVDLLLENRAELLLALEHLSMEAMRLPPEDHSLISFDANDYRLLRVEELRMSALAAADKVKKTRVPFHFNPMSSRERRVIHLALRDEKELRSESVGVGPFRAVVVIPADMPTPPAPPISRPPHRAGRAEGFGNGRDGRHTGRREGHGRGPGPGNRPPRGGRGRGPR